MQSRKFLTRTGPLRPRQQRRWVWASAVLRLAVHIDAFLLDPQRYLHALMWKLQGKRLRSRLTLAPLLGCSRFAYLFWMAQQQGGKEENPLDCDNKALLTALFESGDGNAPTISSLADEDVAFWTVTKCPTAELLHLQKIRPHSWLLLMKSGDLLAARAGAIYRLAVSQATEETHIIYADDDLIYGATRYHPHFKPDWNSELYDHFDFLTGAAILRLRDLDCTDLPATGWQAALIKRAVKRSEKDDSDIVHLPQILHHRPMRPVPQLPTSCEISAESFAELAPITVLVPTRNGLAFLRECLNGLARTDYPYPLEIAVIDNGSDDEDMLDYLATLDSSSVRVLRDNGPFNFSALNNRGVDKTTSELLCFLNNDIEIADSEWLMIMASQALRKSVGAVGCRLLYPDGRIQHAGVVLGVGGGAAHAHRLLNPDDEGYFQRHSLPQFVSAVTAACMVVRRDKFEAVGGFDVDSFPVSFNDVDLCMKLNKEGWKTFYEPRATLIHHESVSRGFDRDPAGAARLAEELSNLQNRWGTSIISKTERDQRTATDPYHHPALSPFSEQFVLRL